MVDMPQTQPNQPNNLWLFLAQFLTKPEKPC